MVFFAILGQARIMAHRSKWDQKTHTYIKKNVNINQNHRGTPMKYFCLMFFFTKMNVADSDRIPYKV